jgi:protein translocase SecG subunit
MSDFLNFIQNFLMPIQTFFLVVAIILILIQNRGSGLSTAFGGNNEIYLTRRGIEKWVVNFTVVSIVAFVILRFVDLYF